jgi:hypothetical protein
VFLRSREVRAVRALLLDERERLPVQRLRGGEVARAFF